MEELVLPPGYVVFLSTDSKYSVNCESCVSLTWFGLIALQFTVLQGTLYFETTQNCIICLYFQVFCVLMVAHNFLLLLVGIKALPVGAKVNTTFLIYCLINTILFWEIILWFVYACNCHVKAKSCLYFRKLF